MDVQQAIAEALDVAAQEVGVLLKSRWEKGATEVLSGGKRSWMLRSYLESIHLWDVKPGSATVTVGFPLQVGSPTPDEKIALLAEQGAPETDMREYMLAQSTKVKTSKEGVRYRIVPIDKSDADTGSYLEDAVKGQPAKIVRRLRDVLKDAKRDPFLSRKDKYGKHGDLAAYRGDWKDRGAHFQKELRQQLGKEEGTAVYKQLGRLRTHHKDILIERSYAMSADYAADAVTGKTTKQLTGMRTFRTITEDNGGWMRPAMAPAGIWEIISADMDIEVAKVAQQAFEAAFFSRTGAHTP